MTPRGAKPKPSDVEVQLVSDGTPAGTHVLLPDGTELRHVTHVTWDLDANDGRATALLTIGHINVDLRGRLDVRPQPTQRS